MISSTRKAECMWVAEFRMHTTVQYRSFKLFDHDTFVWDLSLASFANDVILKRGKDLAKTVFLSVSGKVLL